MKKTSISRIGTTLGLLLLAGAPARADFTSWSFNWSGQPTAVASDSGGTGGIFLLDPQPGHAQGSATILGTQLSVFSDTPTGTLDHFTAKPYTETLTIKDDASNASGAFVFSGVFGGTLSKTQADITNTFLGKTTESLKLGNHLYTVAIGPYLAPTIATPGSFSAHVTLDASAGTGGGSGGGTGAGGGGAGGNAGGGGVGPGTHDAPEPTTLVLGGIGLASLGLGWLRNRMTSQNRTAGTI